MCAGRDCSDVGEVDVLGFLLNGAFYGGDVMGGITLGFSYIRVSEESSFVSDGDSVVS